MSIFWTKKYSFCFVVSIQRSYILKSIIKRKKILKTGTTGREKHGKDSDAEIVKTVIESMHEMVEWYNQ